jgi:tetratricopeptide (TPR) repeat protein
MIGRTLAHYEVVEEISRGGMGVVYRARDLDLDRDIALKVLPAELTSDRPRRERLLREARAASALEHPNIAVIHGVGEAEGVAYIAMELIRGEKLLDSIARAALQVRRALDLAIEIAEGLTRAHDKGVIHRDLKPANVMVTEDGHAKIIDFGLAKLVPTTESAEDETATADSPHTAPGQVLGTVAYMSPEQARGTPIDYRSDVFSFGVLLFELLARHRPFAGPTEVDTLQAILSQPIPSLPALSGLPTELVAGIQRVITKCVEKDRDERYQTMKDAVVDLKAVRRQLESTTTRSIAGHGGGRVTLGRPAWLIGGVLVVAAAVWLWRPWPGPARVMPPDDRPAVAVMYFENQTGDEALDWMRTGLATMMVTDLSQDVSIEVLGTDRLYQILDNLHRADDAVISADVIEQVARQADVDRVVIGSYVKAGETIRIDARLQEAASGRIVASERVEGPGEAVIFSLVDELTRRIKAQMAQLVRGPVGLLRRPGDGRETGSDRDVADVTTSSVEALRVYTEGIRLHERHFEAEAAAMFERAIDIDPEFAMAMSKLAVVSSNLLLADKSDEYARRALDHSDRLTPRERYYIQGVYFTKRLDTYQQAIDAYRQGLQLYPGDEPMRINLGHLYSQLEQFPEAIEQFQEVVRRGTASPVTFGNLAYSYARTGQLGLGRQLTERFAADHPQTAIAYLLEGHADLLEGDPVGALASYGRAVALDPLSPTTSRGQLGALLMTGRWGEASRLTSDLSEGPSPAHQVLGLRYSAKAALLQGQAPPARAALGRVVSLPGASVADVMLARVELARLLDETGDTASALAVAQAAAAATEGRLEDREALAILAVISARAGRDAEAREALLRLEDLLDRAPPHDAGQGLLDRVRGQLALESGDLTAAIAALSAAAERLTPRGWFERGDHVVVWAALASAHLAAGDDGAAAPVLQRITAAGVERFIDPVSFVRAHHLLAQLYERRGDTASASELYSRFLDFWGDGDLSRSWVEEARAKIGLD